MRNRHTDVQLLRAGNFLLSRHRPRTGAQPHHNLTVLLEEEQRRKLQFYIAFGFLLEKAARKAAFKADLLVNQISHSSASLWITPIRVRYEFQIYITC